MNSDAIVVVLKTNNRGFPECLNSVQQRADKATHEQMCGKNSE